MKKLKSKTRWFMLALFALMTAIGFAGCSVEDSGDDSISSLEGDLRTYEKVGINVCTNCHYGQVSQWIQGQHANVQAIDHDTHADLDLGLDSDGFPYYGYSGLGTDPESNCASCHDPEGDGRNLVADLTGNTSRPVIGCESCHGGGNNHYGIGPIETPTPDYQTCGNCHNSEFDHLAYHPNGDNILEEYMVSPHFNSINDHTYIEEGSTEVRARCSRCHTDEGFRKYNSIPGTTGYSDLTDEFEHLANISNASAVQCRTCHDPHTTKEGDFGRVSETKNSDGVVTQTSEFNTCTSCHQLNDANGVAMTDAYHDPSVNQYGSLEEVITDTHAMGGDPTRVNTGDNAGDYIFIKADAVNSCAGCHNPHLADNTINKQWARSAHGNPTGEPWKHYDWKAANRSSCSRCHSTTGFVNYNMAVAGGESYDASKNDFSYLTPASTNAEGAVVNLGQNETLYCWGCHSDYKGGIRNPGPITADYVDMDGTAITFPDVSASNVCMACHTGREGGGSIANSTADFSSQGFINSHYLTAGATLFNVSGYEYSGLDYSNENFYEHDRIGSVDANGNAVVEGTGTNGPCVGCHMTTSEKHLFLPVTEDETTGEITAVNSTACASCHGGGFEMTPATLNERKNLHHDGLEALKIQLQQSGFYFSASYPYFYSDAAGTSAVRDWTTGGDATTGKPNMGAAYNYNLFEHDPGAYAHNNYYVKRLLYDSFDWLDDNLMNGSVGATLTASPHAGASYQAGAQLYFSKRP
ncbi:MAG: hypothetical protein HQM13_20475 [SAR324 cluster bacterium]|nr:hypothetical protein [SAR324 cluster bacterium]